MTGAYLPVTMGRCDFCGGDDALLYDVGGPLYCERCHRGFLAVTDSYMVEQGVIFFLLHDGTLTNGDQTYSSVDALLAEHAGARLWRPTFND